MSPQNLAQRLGVADKSPDSQHNKNIEQEVSDRFHTEENEKGNVEQGFEELKTDQMNKELRLKTQNSIKTPDPITELLTPNHQTQDLSDDIQGNQNTVSSNGATAADEQP